MTIVGKILVFLCLVFALIAGGMMMLLFMTRINWEDGFRKMESSYVAVKADRDQTKIEYDNARKDNEDKLDKATKDRDAALKARDDLRKQLTTAEDKLNAIQAKGRADNADITAIQAALESRKLQVGELTKAVDKLHEEKREIIALKEEERKLRIKADVDARTFQSRAVELENQVKEMAREIVRVQSGAAGTVVARKKGEENPPLDNVHGQVVTADPEDNLVKLSIGSDAGLIPGHTLKVFRLDPIPERSRYLGVIEIMSVRPHEAVGRPLKPMAVSMRPGDRVAARLGN